MKLRKLLSAGMATAMLFAACAGFTGCGTTSTDSSGSSDSGKNTAEYTIGISQFAEHPSLDNCREGFLAGLAEEGIVEGENLKVLYDNAQSDTSITSSIASSYISQNVDMIAAIATPSAAAAFNAAKDTDIPVIYTAISDPAEAGLADEDGNSTGNITGSSDRLPVKEQLQMIRKIMPDAKTIGIIYTTSEANSVSTIKTYKELAGDYDFTIVETGINTIADVDLAASDIASKVDCICNLTDNTVVQALQTVLDKASSAGIPVFGSEIEQVKNGCLASMGIDYYELGKETGIMAASILRGEAEAENTPFIEASSASLYVNNAVAKNLGITIDADYVNSAAEVFEEITVE